MSLLSVLRKEASQGGESEPQFGKEDLLQWPLAQSASDLFAILDLLEEEWTLEYDGTTWRGFTGEEQHRLMQEALPKQFKDSDWTWRRFDEQHFIAAISSLKEASE